jgi:hypothetical protein
MKKLLIGAALCALFATPVLAADSAPANAPIKLSLAQMDGLTAGACVVAICVQKNFTSQTATAVAVGGNSFFSAFSSNATAVATNVNKTEQEID